MQVYIINEPTNARYQFISENPDHQYFDEPHKINIDIAADRAVLGIDPSTNGTGIVIADLDNQGFETFIHCRRSSEEDEYKDGNIFVDELITFLEHLIVFNQPKIQRCQIEMMTMYRKKDNFAHASLLKSCQERICSLLKQYGITYYTVYPNVWKKPYLAMHPSRYVLDYTQANKQEIRYVGEQQFPKLKGLPKYMQDIFDAIGITYYYFVTNHEGAEGGVIKVTKSLERSYKSNFYKTVLKYKDDDQVHELTKCIQTHLVTYGLKGEIKVFEYCKDLSIDDNFRALLSLDSSSIYVSVIDLEPKLIAQLYEYKKDLGTLQPGQQLILLGACRF